jgi:hypothetical protein
MTLAVPFVHANPKADPTTTTPSSRASMRRVDRALLATANIGATVVRFQWSAQPYTASSSSSP